LVRNKRKVTANLLTVCVQWRASAFSTGSSNYVQRLLSRPRILDTWWFGWRMTNLTIHRFDAPALRARCYKGFSSQWGERLRRLGRPYEI